MARIKATQMRSNTVMEVEGTRVLADTNMPSE